MSIVSAGGIRIAFDKKAAFTYLKETCGGRTPDDLLDVLAGGMTTISARVKELAKTSNATVKVTRAVANYLLPGCDAFGYCEITNVPAIEGAGSVHAVRGVRPGSRSFKVLEDNIAQRHIPVHLDTPAERLIWRQGEGVRGVRVSRDGASTNVKARKAVILACGGFEANEDMKRQYCQAMPVLTGRSSAIPAMESDGPDVGAALWHMWHYHGPYGLKHPDPDYPYGLYLKAIPMWTPGRADATSYLGVVDAKGVPTPAKTRPNSHGSCVTAPAAASWTNTHPIPAISDRARSISTIRKRSPSRVFRPSWFSMKPAARCIRSAAA